MEALQTRYRVMAKQARDKLGKLKRDPSEPTFDLSIEVTRLVGLAHTYVQVSKCGEFVVEYLVGSLENKALQCHLLSVDTSTAAKTVRAVEDYLAIRDSDRHTCKTVGESGELAQLVKLMEVLNAWTETISAQSEMLSAQSGVLTVQSENI